MLYGGALHGKFMIDDYSMILGLAPMDHFQNLLVPAQMKNFFMEEESPFVFRPVSKMYLLIFFHFFGNNPFYYHLAYVFLFSVYCFLVYILLRRLTGALDLSLYGSLLFCVHPINTIPVNYLSGYAIVFGILGMVSLISFLRYIETQSNVALVLSMGTYVLSFLTHEIMIILPAYMALILIFIRKYRWRGILRAVAPFFLIAIIYLILRLALFHHIASQVSSQALNPLTFLGVLTELIFWYVGKLLVPGGIVPTWGIGFVPVEAAIRNIILLGVILTGIIFLIGRRRDGVIPFAFTWFLLGFVPLAAACFVYPEIGFVIEPHWFFLSSLGFFILAASALVWIGRVTNRKIAGVIFLGVMTILFFRTQGYHRVWKDEKTYCQYWLGLSPQNGGPNFWLAHAYLQEGDYENAQRFFGRAIAGDFMDWKIYSNLGLIASQKRNFSLAKKYFTRSLEINPHATPVYSNMGVVYLRENDLPEAEKYFDRSLKIDPYLIEPRLNLALIAKKSGHMEKAVRLYEENLRIDPWNPPSLYSLIEYNLEENFPKAERLSRRLLNSRRDVKAATLTDLGSLFAGRNHIRLASLFYERALKTDPAYKEVYLESGKLHGNLEHWPEAISTWEAGLALDPADSRFSELIREAKELQSQTKNQVRH